MISEEKTIDEERLIVAEFMGIKEVNVSVYSKYDLSDSIYRDLLKITLCKDLPFDTSWDWLIPVMAKSNSMFSEKVIPSGFPNIGDRLQTSILNNNITEAFKCMVEVVEWYNDYFEK